MFASVSTLKRKLLSFNAVEQVNVLKSVKNVYWLWKLHSCFGNKTMNCKLEEDINQHLF